MVEFWVLIEMSVLRGKQSLECGRMHISALKSQKIPGPLQPQIARFTYATLLHYIRNFRPQKLGSPDQTLDPQLIPVGCVPTAQ